MFTKMRAAIAAERSRADEAEKRLAEYRRQAEEDRRQERETLMAALAEERRCADESQQAFMAAVSELTTQVTRLVERQNGNGRSEH